MVVRIVAAGLAVLIFGSVAIAAGMLFGVPPSGSYLVDGNGDPLVDGSGNRLLAE